LGCFSSNMVQLGAMYITEWYHNFSSTLDPYPYGVKGYIFFDPSMDSLIIERSVQFEESPLHAPLEPHAKNSVLLPAPDINDGECTC
jgi:hypothetical protein